MGCAYAIASDGTQAHEILSDGFQTHGIVSDAPQTHEIVPHGFQTHEIVPDEFQTREIVSDGLQTHENLFFLWPHAWRAESIKIYYLTGQTDPNDTLCLKHIKLYFSCDRTRGVQNRLKSTTSLVERTQTTRYA